MFGNSYWHWQGVGRGSCFISGVSTVQIHSNVHSVPVDIFTCMLWCDMDSYSWNLVPFALLPSHQHKTIHSPEAHSDELSSGT